MEYYIQGLSKQPGKGRQNMTVIQEAVDTCIRTRCDRLVFPEGRYEVYNREALVNFERLMRGELSALDYRFFKDNRNAIIHLDGVENLTIDGGGAIMVAAGLIQGVSLKGCRNIAIRNLAVDWVRPPFSVGEVESVEGNAIRLSMLPAYPVSGGEPVVSYLDIDRDSGKQGGVCVFSEVTNMEKDGAHMVIRHPKAADVKAGSYLVLRHIYSFAPVFLFYQSAEITLEDITLHAGGGMGVIAHKCRDITAHRLSVRPSGFRPMSVNCDATHFISCEGDIRFDDCYFEGMGDDAINVHGFYWLIREIGIRSVVATLDVMTQSLYPDLPDVGDTLEFVKPGTLLPFSSGRIETVLPQGDGWTVKIGFEKELPPELAVGDAVMNVSRKPSLRFENCTVRNIRGRAVLLQNRGAVIRNCLFEDCTGEAIHITTATGWWESGGVRDIEICDNRFIHCGFGKTTYCDAVGVVVNTECAQQAAGVHKDICIHHNHIEGDNVGVALSSCEHVLLEGNRFHGCAPDIMVEHAGDIVVMGEPQPRVVCVDACTGVWLNGEAMI